MPKQTFAYVYESSSLITATNNFVATHILWSDTTIANEGFHGLAMGNTILPSGPYEHSTNDAVRGRPTLMFAISVTSCLFVIEAILYRYP